MKSNNKKISKTIGKILLGLILLVCIAIIVVRVVFHSYYEKLNYDDGEGSLDVASMTTEYVLENDPDIDLTATSSDAEVINNVEEQLRQNLEDKSTPIKFSEDVYNILLIGHDSRNKAYLGNSDSMIIVSINKRTEEIVLTSIMRDCYILRPGYGYGRINGAFAMGGPELLISTIEENFKIQIDGYVAVNFYAFMDIVDALGGVEINVKDEEVWVLNMYVDELNLLKGDAPDTDKLNTGGTYLLNGKQALGYSRIRYVGNADYERTERQRRVLETVFNKLKDSDLSQLNDALNAVLPNVITDIKEGEMLSLLLGTSTEYKDYDIKQCRVPYDGTVEHLNIGGAAVLGIDIQTNIDYMHRDIYGEE